MSAHNLRDLIKAIDLLKAPKDVEFAKSLRDQWERKGYLSEKQAHWVGVLCDRANAPAEPAAPAANCSTDLSALFGLFGKAIESGLKSPRIRLRADAVDVTISMASPNSTNPGHIYVKADGEYAGKITPAGEARIMRHADPAILPALASMAANPAGAALAYGRETGKCCFCGLLLTDERSVTAGFGPVCAENYNLPWG